MIGVNHDSTIEYVALSILVADIFTTDDSMQTIWIQIRPNNVVLDLDRKCLFKSGFLENYM